MRRQKNIALFLMFLAVILFTFGTIPVYASSVTPPAEPTNGNAQSSSAAAVVSSTPPPVSSTPPVSSAPPVSSQKPVSSRKRVVKTSSIASSAASSDLSSVLSSQEESSQIVLPSVGSIAEDSPLNSMAVEASSNSGINWLGIASWALIALGVLVVILVVFSNRRPPTGGPGRKRYHRKPARSKKKHLLNDKYYRNIRY